MKKKVFFDISKTPPYKRFVYKHCSLTSMPVVEKQKGQLQTISDNAYIYIY